MQKIDCFLFYRVAVNRASLIITGSKAPPTLYCPDHTVEVFLSPKIIRPLNWSTPSLVALNPLSLPVRLSYVRVLTTEGTEWRREGRQRNRNVTALPLLFATPLEQMRKTKEQRQERGEGVLSAQRVRREG